jgi:integrase
VTAAGHKSFIVNAWKRGRVHRLTIANCEHLSAQAARDEARKLLGKLATGVNPAEEKKLERAQGVTLEQAFREFLKARKALSPRTVYDYKRLLDTHLADWKDRPLVSITKDKVQQRHAELGEASGAAQANYAMRFLRSLLNFAMVKYEDGKGRSILSENPVKRLSQARAWYRVDRRTNYIKPQKMKTWFNAVLALEDETVRDYLIFVLLTGLRRGEAARLKWAWVDLESRSFTVPDTKNKQHHTLPLSDYLFDMLKRRARTGEYVFPAPGRAGHVVDPRAQLEAVVERSGVAFTPHDLRRTFATAVNNLERSLSYYSIKRLLNHKTQDVTAGYIQHDVESLREPMQQVTDYLLKAASVKQSAQMIQLQAGNQTG